MELMMRRLIAVTILGLTGATQAAAFPLGLGYGTTTESVEITENVKEREYGSFKFNATYHTISILDYTGILCAGFQNAHAQMEARNQALEGAKYDSSVKPGDSVSYSWKAATPQAGSSCGVHLHSSQSDNKADAGGLLGSKTGKATLAGWTAFGVVAKPFAFDPNIFWRLNLMVDVREIKIVDVPPSSMGSPYETQKLSILAMPFDYEVGGVINVPGIAGFSAWGSVGYDMVFWLLKELVPGNFPTSFLRYGAGVGYQTPIDLLMVKLAYKKTDSFVESRGLIEQGYTLGIYYQM